MQSHFNRGKISKNKVYIIGVTSGILYSIYRYFPTFLFEGILWRFRGISP